ncbi:MAG: T9SS type A sorting domain-containing protein [Candidatus Zixiibacteriota bacterium]
MNRSVHLCALFLLVIFICSFGPVNREAKALTIVDLTLPADSTKVTSATPTFQWQILKPTEKETPRRFQIDLSTDPSFTTVFWEDTTIAGGDRDKLYNGPSLSPWNAYYWRMRVQIDSTTTQGIKTFWQDEFTSTFTFFYTAAKVLRIPTDLPTIQVGIVWAATGDTILVQRGTYYENLRFYNNGLKDSLIVASNYLLDHDTATINRTIIDGSHLTRGKDNGSVVFFAGGVDSTSKLIGFTIRGGTGTRIKLPTEERISGGGIFCDAGSSPTISFNAIVDNRVDHDGGGIFLSGAAPNVFHNVIARNQAAKGSGGGIECGYSIQVAAQGSPSPDERGEGRKETVAAEEPKPDGKTQASPASSESVLQRSEGQTKTSLNPKDGTVVASSPQNTPPIAVVTWYARRDTVIHRSKYLPGDTLFFSGSGSHDPDPGDSITEYRWQYLQNYVCWKTQTYSPQSLGSDSVALIAIKKDSQLGLVRVFLRVADSGSPVARGYSDTTTFNVQYPPHADAGVAQILGIADTAWLDGKLSCDINPGDILSYHWSQLSGPIPATIVNADSTKAYFVPLDATFGGIFKFLLTVSDGDTVGLDTVQITVDRPPIAVCQNDPSGLYGDTIVGLTVSDSLILDGSLSHDPDLGDTVKFYLWQPVYSYFPGKTGFDSLGFSAITDSTKKIQKIRAPGEGLFKFWLRVRDRYGVISQNHDSVFYSVQVAPGANAGRDTILLPQDVAYLQGRVYEVNPDQRKLIRYNWSLISAPTSIIIQPSVTSQSIHFNAPFSGVYKLGLVVQDTFFALSKPDTVLVVANKRPIASVVNIAHAFEGKTDTLNASSSYDPDSSVFQAPGSSSAGGLKFTWSVAPNGVPLGAEAPILVNADKPKANFIPYGTGVYKFYVTVNDTISVRQPPDTARSLSDTGNVVMLTVTVDSTYAYPIIQGNLISHNSSGSKGGGIDCNQSSVDIINNIFYKNQSQSSGGAICCKNFSTPQIKSNIFFGNISSDSMGGAIADLKGSLSPSATRGFRKNLAVQYNDFWGNQGGTLYQISGNISNNLDSFPRLIDPDFEDFRLECNSPCFGKGDPLHPDIGSLLRFQPCGTVDNLKTVWLSLLQNPVATAVAHFVVNTDAPVKGTPVGYVVIDDRAPSLVYFTPISPRSYRGSYVFPSSGNASVSIFASSVVEKDTVVVDTISVQLIAAGKEGQLTNYDKKVAAFFPEGTARDELYATCISVSADPRYGFDEQTEAQPIGKAYQLGPSILFEKNPTVSFPLTDSELKERDISLFSIYQFEDGKWSQMESFLEGNSVCARVKSLGVFRLIYDPTGKHVAGIPRSYDLLQNYPNPFNPETQIRYDLPVPGHVELAVYNVLGQRVRLLVDQVQDAGRKSAVWDGKNQDGQDVASGIYFYKVKTDSFEKTKKMVLLR